MSQLVWDVSQRRDYNAASVVFGAAREFYPWRHEQAVHDVQDRLLALVART